MTEILDTHGLSVSYNGVSAVKEVDMTISPLNAVAVIGANGAGKTSLLRAIGGQVASTGTVMFNGTSIGRLAPHKIARMGFAQVPQGRRLFPELTVEENLWLGTYARTTSSTDLDEVFTLFPRLRERRNQRAGSLSGGEQQMVAIGRSMVAAPVLLAMDEPSLGLAPILVGEIFEVIRELRKRDSSILLVEQNAKKALEVTDYVYVMERGRVVYSEESARAIDEFDLVSGFLSPK